jgi:hypothetical protein
VITSAVALLTSALYTEYKVSLKIPNVHAYFNTEQLLVCIRPGFRTRLPTILIYIFLSPPKSP